MNAVIHPKGSSMAIEPNVKLPLKQHVLQPVNKLNIKTDHLSEAQSDHYREY